MPAPARAEFEAPPDAACTAPSVYCAERDKPRKLSLRPYLRDAAQALAEQQGGATWLDMGPAVPGVDMRSATDRALVRATVENMVRVGELERVGSHKPPGARCWMALYVPATTAASPTPPAEADYFAALTAALGRWHSEVPADPARAPVPEPSGDPSR